MGNDRIIRIAAEIKKALSFIIHESIKDPRISPMASVTKVELTRDLKFAKAYISVYDTPEKRKSTIEALQHAEGFIKMKVGETVKIRSMPHFTFLLDDSVEYSLKISKLLNELGVSSKNAETE